MFSKLYSVLHIVFCVSIFSMASCGKEESKASAVTEGKISDNEFVIKSGTPKFESNVLSGEGKVLAKLPAGEQSGEKNFELSFTLEDSGSLTLHAFASNSLESGLKLNFTRQGRVLKVQLSSSALTSPLDLTSAFSGVDASGTIGVLVDVHNGESPAHILAWTADILEPEGENAVYDSQRDEAERGAFVGQGGGTFWGLELSKAKITLAKTSDVKAEDEE